MFSKKGGQFFRKTVTVFVALTTIAWSFGFPAVPVAWAVPPYVMMVEYVNPTTFQVKFDQLMNNATISTSSFTLTTAATDTETISSVTPSVVNSKTVVTVVASSAKISPSAGNYVVVATSGANAPENGSGQDNADGGMIGFVAQPGQVVISEVKLSGSSETDEFIEIYNPTGSTVTITGWKVTVLAQDGTPTDLATFADPTTIAAGKFRLIAPTGTSNVNDAYTPSGNGIAANNTIILYQAIGGGMFRVSDMVGCGTATIKETSAYPTCPAANTSLERKTSPASTAASMDASSTPAGAQSAWGNTYDSNNNSYDFVIQTGTGVNPQSSSSAAETPGGGGGGYQNQPPTINHMPVFQVISGQQAMFMAQIADPETPPQSLTASLIYSTNNWTSSTTLTGQNMSGNEFKFLVPAADTGSGTGTAFKYYLKVTDANTNSSCMYNMGGPCGTADATAKTGSWTVASTSSAGMTNSIKGRVMSGATGIDNAMVTLRGAGLTFNTTSATDGVAGAFTFSNIPAGMFRIEASAPGYSLGWLDGIVSKTSGAAYTDNTINLTAGSGGQGGDTTSPRVIFSAPMDGMMGAPTKINIPATGNMEAPINIGFSKAMDSTTITTSNIKVYPVTAAGLGTALSGVSVAYQAAGGSATLTDRGNRQVSFGLDAVAVVYSDTALSANSQYVVDLSAGVKDSAGNILQGNKAGGGHSISFTTSGDFTSYNTTQMTSGFNTFMTTGGGGGQFTPPYVTGSTPSNGAKNVPTNAKIIVNFSQPMDSTGINATNGTGTYVKLYDTNYNNSGSGQYVTVESIALDSNTRQMATITVGGTGLAASHSNYAVRVLGGARSATGVSMAMPGQETNTMYQADFSTGSGGDTGAPTVLSTTLQTYTAVTPCTATICVSGVPTNVGVIELSFSKDMDSSTLNSSNITLQNGNTSVSTTVAYDPLSRSVKLTPNTVLYTVTTYTLTVGTGVKAMNGTSLAAAYTVSFTTNSAVDSTGPTVMMANGDDYKLAITFSEPMNAAKATDTANWTTSVLNPTNYVLYVNNSPPPFVLGTNTAKYFGNDNLSTATDTAHGGPVTLKYDAAYNTVVIEGLKMLDTSLSIKGGFNVWVQNVKDISGNVIQDTTKPANVNDFGANAAGGPIMDAKTTFGNIGPGGGGMSGPPTTTALSGGATQVTAFGGKDPAMMGFKPINVFPVNMLAGQESMYMIDLPLTTAIPASGQIILTFPVGFDVTNATDADSSKKWAHADINGPGTGTVVISAVTANATARTVTITLGAVATQANDFLHLEIDRIKNTTKASDGDMTNGVTMGVGYQVDVYTKTAVSAGSRTLGTLKSMPFFIKAAGSSTLTGTITFKNAAGVNSAVTLNNLPIYLMSPMTGPLKTLVNFSGSATATYTFSNLPTGNYMLGTEPLQAVSSVDYFVDLSPLPQSLDIAAGTNTKNIVFQEQSSANKPNLTVYITGIFSNESVDIFAGGPSGFTVKTVTLNGTLTNASPSTQTLYLPATGTWSVGMGPAMPRGPQQSGPPPMPSWMPPRPIEVNASGSGPSWTWKDADGAATGDTSASDGKITLAVTTADKTISGHVYGPTGSTGIQNAMVNAFSPMGGMGSYAESGADGAFSLKVMDGSYQVGAFIPGMPPSQQVPVEVKTVSSVTTVYANGVATTDLILRVQNPSSMYTISGKVTDGTNVIKDASVYARRTDGPGNVGTKTDSMGKYILYVQAGTWAVGVFLPQYGNLTEQTVTVSTASQADIDFAPSSSTTFRTVKDRVYKDVDNSGAYSVGDTLLANVHVDFEKTGYHNGAMTDQNGQYTILVPDGVYTVAAWSPDVGKIPPQTVTVAADMNLTGNADLPVADTRTVIINFVDGSGSPVTVSEAYVQMDKLSSQNISNETSRENVSSLTLTVPAGTGYEYVLDVDIPGIIDSSLRTAGAVGTTVTGTDVNSDSVNDIYKVAVDGNETINITVPALYTVSGTAKDDSNNLLTDTVINIKKDNSDEIALAVKTDSSGSYSVQLPASDSGAYLFQIDKAGYIDTGISVVVDGTKTQNLVAAEGNLTISGQILAGSSGVDGAKVYAKELGGGFASTETDAQGNYVLSVTGGDWKVSATSDDYQEKEYQNSSSQDIVVSLSGSDQAGINVTLTTLKTGLADINNADVTPSSGATFEHSAAGLELIAPQNAIAASQATYQMEDYEVANVTSTPTAKTIGGKAISISTYEPSGSFMVPKSSFSDDVTIKKTYTVAELAAAGIDTFTEAEGVKMSYFDESASNWEPVLTDIVYLDINNQPVIPNNTLSNVTSVVYAGVSDHMTVYSPTNGSPDGLAPSSPSSAVGSASSGQITVSWTAPTTNADGTALTDLLGYEVYRSTSAGGTFTQVNTSDVSGVSYVDSTVVAGNTYYYKVTAADTGGIESSMSTVTTGVSAYIGGGGGGGIAFWPTPSPSPSPSPSVSPSPSASPSPSLTPSPAPLALVPVPEVPVNPTMAQLQAAIAAIQNNIAVLLAELTKLQLAEGKVSAFVHDLQYATVSSPEVKRLQGFLISKGYLGAGLDTGNYLSKTVQAVKAYQQAKGITPVNGRFGPKTREAMNKDLGF
jgi:hypothetical protein